MKHWPFSVSSTVTSLKSAQVVFEILIIDWSSATQRVVFIHVKLTYDNAYRSKLKNSQRTIILVKLAWRGGCSNHIHCVLIYPFCSSPDRPTWSNCATWNAHPYILMEKNGFTEWENVWPHGTALHMAEYAHSAIHCEGGWVEMVRR